MYKNKAILPIDFDLLLFDGSLNNKRSKSIGRIALFLYI